MSSGKNSPTAAFVLLLLMETPLCQHASAGAAEACASVQKWHGLN